MSHKQYIEARWNQNKSKYRMRLAFEQLANYPFLILLLAPLALLGLLLWNIRKDFMNYLDVMQISNPFYNYISIFITVLLVFLVLIWILEEIGEITAQKIEADIQESFTEHDMRNGCPILMSKKRVKKTKVMRLIFYSTIPLSVWIEKSENICTALNVYLAEEISHYNNHGRMVVLYVVKGITQQKREGLYDDEL